MNIFTGALHRVSKDISCGANFSPCVDCESFIVPPLTPNFWGGAEKSRRVNRLTNKFENFIIIRRGAKEILGVAPRVDYAGLALHIRVNEKAQQKSSLCSPLICVGCRVDCVSVILCVYMCVCV